MIQNASPPPSTERRLPQRRLGMVRAIPADSSAAVDENVRSDTRSSPESVGTNGRLSPGKRMGPRARSLDATFEDSERLLSLEEIERGADGMPSVSSSMVENPNEYRTRPSANPYR